MCYFQGQPVGAYCSCCQNCSSYLTECTPTVTYGGYVVGECDFSFCEYCSVYEQCELFFGKEMDIHEIAQL